MKVKNSWLLVILVVVLAIGCSKKSDPTGPGGSGTNPISDRPLIIDHSCIDLGMVPQNWIDSAQAKCRMHYAHTSHGGQLIYGLDTVYAEDSAYHYAIGYGSLPTAAGAFRILDGQISETYITPELYWQTANSMNLTRNVLNSNPTINCSV